MDFFIQYISSAFKNLSPYTEYNMRGIVRKAVLINVRDYKHWIIDGQIRTGSLEWNKIILYDIFADLFDRSIYFMNNFAVAMPGFGDLEENDKMLTIKLGVFEVWLVHAAREINPLTGTITFSNGYFLSRQQMAIMFGHEFTTMLFNFAISFNRLQLNDSEIALFSVAVLFTAGRCGIKDVKSILQNHLQLLTALKYELNKGHSNAHHIFETLVSMLPEIRMLGEKYLEQLGWFRTNWTHLQLPDFFAEIYDFPKPKFNIAIRSKL